MNTSNANDLADRQVRRIAALNDAVRKGVAAGAVAIESAAIANLSGAGGPYSYPVPTPTGHLRGSMKVEQPVPVMAIIFNSADYAWAVHSGDVNEFRSHYVGPSDVPTMAISRPGRPFLDDAVKATPYADIVINKVMQTLTAGGAF